MKKLPLVALVAVVGFAFSLIALGQYAYAQGSSLPDGDFCKSATVKDVIEVILEGSDIHAVGASDRK